MKEVRTARERMNIKAILTNRKGKIIESKSREKEPNLLQGKNGFDEPLKVFGTDTTCLVLKDGSHF
jgi:hypothetical protein